MIAFAQDWRKTPDSVINIVAHANTMLHEGCAVVDECRCFSGFTHALIFVSIHRGCGSWHCLPECAEGVTAASLQRAPPCSSCFWACRSLSICKYIIIRSTTSGVSSKMIWCTTVGVSLINATIILHLRIALATRLSLSFLDNMPSF